MSATDTLGVPIVIGDTVTVTAYGSPIRLIDTGRRATVTGFTRTGNVTLLDPTPDPVARGRAVRPGCLAVARRDGTPGHEGNVR
jgi:hypothetical protein